MQETRDPKKQLAELKDLEGNLRFPMLSRECPRGNHSAFQNFRPKGSRKRVCEICSVTGYGSGRVTHCTTNALMDGAESLGRPVLRKIHDGTWIMDIWLTGQRNSYSGSGPTYNDALATALLAAVGARA
jgi:hypothetical protein